MPTVISRQEDRALIATGEPKSAVLWAEIEPGKPAPVGDDGLFVFQYWPESVQDSATVDYATKKIPGASHPLYQWVGGGERTITFTAKFTAEIDPDDPLTFDKSLLPSGRYTVDVAAALNKLRSFMRGDYPEGSDNGRAKPPKRLYLILENMRLGGTHDDILCILKSAPITYQACFPSGHPRVAEVSLTFAEIIQHGVAGEASQITYIGRSPFESAGRSYRYRGTVDRVQGS